MTAPRILFYCHNAIGLGHVIRSIRMAEAATLEGARCGIVTGCRFLSTLGVPPGIEVELLPPVRLDASGRPVAWDGDDKGNIVARRSACIVGFLARWRPEAIIVDHHPLGLGGELVDGLLESDARFILGVPYSEGLAVRSYRNPRLRRAITRYRDVLDYSDNGASTGIVQGDGISKPRTVHVGIVTRAPLPIVESGGPPRVVALAGGGTDGAEVYRLLVAAMRELLDWQLRFVVGPFGDPAAVTTLARERPGIEIWANGSAEEAIQDATIVVSRAGYNTSYSLVQTDRPIILIPQQRAGDDQPARARRLAELPKVWNLDSRDPALVSVLANLLRGDLAPVTRPLPFSINGAQAAAREIIRLVREDRGQSSGSSERMAHTHFGST